ncbi:MAG: hypothetical protein KGD63_13385 [Candidatus Lokiarchaeota archaeon]|nr:hypothetical protein [Candidatus Lokiarchaeota archaeon]
MNESLEQIADKIINQDVKNIKLISYFKRSTKLTPVFLSVINKFYAEIRPLLNSGLIKDLEPVKSYIFNIDKYENFFYSKYQEEIDLLKDDIWKKKKKKVVLTEMTESMTPEYDSENYDDNLKKCLEFAQKSVLELDEMEQEKEDSNDYIGNQQKEMQKDPYYQFLIFIRSDNEIIFNKRTEDNDNKIHKKVLLYLNKTAQGNVSQMLKDIIKKNFYKKFSPAKNYYITQLGKIVDIKLKIVKWNQEDEYDKNEAERVQDKEYDKLKELYDLSD